MKKTHWKCANCKRIKLLGEEIARADMGAICKSCQAGNSDAHTSPDAAAQEQAVYVFRRGIQRRHARQNWETDD